MKVPLLPYKQFMPGQALNNEFLYSQQLQMLLGNQMDGACIKGNISSMYK